MALWLTWEFAGDPRAAPKAHSTRARSKPRRSPITLWRSFHEITSPSRGSIFLPRLAGTVLFRGSRWDRSSWFLYILFMFDVHSTVLVQTPQMDRDEKNDSQRQNDDVQHIKAQQRVRIHSVSTEKNQAQLFTNKWSG